MLLSKSEVIGSKKSKFIKQQVDSGFWSSLGIKTALSKVLFIRSSLVLRV